MTTEDIYNRFGTPSNLRRHMLSVAGLVSELKFHWTGEVLNWELVLQAALLHDIGNLVKFDLDKFPELLGDELSRVDFWRKEQQRVIEKYGEDDHVVTDKMLAEIDIDKRARDIIQSKSFGNAKRLAKSDDWYPKILLYCDLRVLPDGVGTLKRRILDVKKRLKKYSERSDFNELTDACFEIENGIQNSISADLSEVITQENAFKHTPELLAYKFS